MWEYEVETVLDGLGYEFKFQIGEYDYDWKITKVFVRDGHVFELVDSGCSCNGYGSEWDDASDVLNAMEEVTKLPPINPLVDNDKLREQYRALGIR